MPHSLLTVWQSKLVWSNAGYIAQIVEGGRKIALRTTVRNIKTGAWNLTAESKHPIEAPPGAAFKHLETSHLGMELAAVDSHGRVWVYSSAHMPIGKMSQTQQQPEDSKIFGSDMDAVVGMHWLGVYPTEFKVSMISSPCAKLL